MDITFEAESVHVSTDYRNSSVNVTVEANGRHIAEKLDLDDRLYEIDLCDIVEELGAEELMQEIGAEEVRKWLLANSDPDDTLEHIGLDKIQKFLSHGTPDGDSPV